jgi:pimeloyl-ACP methyl ester carboxylesterase
MAAFGVLLLWRLSRRPDAARAEESAVAPPRVSHLPARLGDTMRWVGAALLVVALVGVVGVSRQLRSADVVVPAFYDTPAQVPDEPGRLLRSERFPGTLPPGADVRRILYTTTDAQGGPAVASGLVIAPRTPPSGPRPVVAWNHGTTGIARPCAPSLLEHGATADAIPAVEDAVARGWVVVATDYSGQGAEGSFPYLIGEGEARSSLDAVRAAHELTDLDLSDRTAVWGHSQGGHAALWTAALAPSYAPGLDIVGTVAISPAAEPIGLARRLLASPSSALLSVAVAWVLIPYSETYDDVAFDDHVALPARPLVREISQRCTSQPSLIVSALSGAGIAGTRPLYRGDLTGGAVGARLEQNATLGPFGAPLLLAWGSADEVIPADLQHDYVARLCAAGVPLEQVEYPGETHLGVVQPGSPLLDPLVAWTAARFAGAPADAAAPPGASGC